MGWVSSSDPMQATNIMFSSREAAEGFAVRNGFEYWVDEPRVAHKRKKVYAENFTYSSEPLRLIRTK
jgi:NADH dehydrogenase (ubiquinone) Fe-S protein 4